MQFISVTNPTIQRLLLEHVIETIESEDGFDALLESGFSPEFLDAIRHRKARDLLHISNSIKTTRFCLSQNEIMGHMQHLDRVRRDHEMREYFVRNGASRAMLVEYFKMSSDEVRRLRDVLLPAGTAAAGRTPLPPPAVRDQIHVAWSAINKQFPIDSERERIYRLHQQFDSWSLDTLNETVREFGGPPSTVHPSRAGRPVTVPQRASSSADIRLGGSA